MNKDYLLIKNILVQNANAMPSAYTIGFPAITAFMGFIHAIQRKLNSIENYENVSFSALAIACHDFKMHVYKGVNDFDYSIIGTANPLTKGGKRPSFIEEPRCNINISLIIDCKGINAFNKEDIIKQIKNILYAKVKCAGGDILDFNTVEYRSVIDSVDAKKLLASCMPSYFIIERRELIKDYQIQDERIDALDALIDYTGLHVFCEKNDNENRVTWKTERKSSGWIIPITVGFQGISKLTEPGKTLCQRDPRYCHRFAEAIVTLGEFKMPHHFDNINDLMWHYEHREKDNLYLCVNQKGD